MMLMRICLGAAIIFVSGATASAGDLMFGCVSRPTCGKVCKLVCEKTTLTQIAYGCECDTVCIPGPSKPCELQCKACCKDCDGAPCDCCCSHCGGKGCSVCREESPKATFWWFNWVPCGCSCPKTVKKLTKYEVTKEVCSYHWEVVDGCGCNCGCGPDYGNGIAPYDQGVYKSAPEDAQVGDVFSLTVDELAQVAPPTP